MTCLEVKNNACPLRGRCSGIPRCLAPLDSVYGIFVRRTGVSLPIIPARSRGVGGGGGGGGGGVGGGGGGGGGGGCFKIRIR